MEEFIAQQRNQKYVRVLSWILIVLSALVLLRSIFTLQGLSTMVTIKVITKNFNPPVELNYTPYIIQSAIEILLCVVIFVSSTFVLKFRRVWKQILVYSLIASIIFLIVTPLVHYFNPTLIKIDTISGADREMMRSMLFWSYIWSILFTFFFVYIILKLSKKEVNILFK